MWGWSLREEQTLVGGSDESSWSESTDATAVVETLCLLFPLAEARVVACC